MLNFLRRMLDPHDATLELHDVAGIGLITAFIYCGIRLVHLEPTHFSMQDFGIGSGALLTALSGAGWMKGKQRQVDPACQDKEKAKEDV